VVVATVFSGGAPSERVGSYVRERSERERRGEGAEKVGGSERERNRRR
jgi:hypothetical protein